MNEALVLVAQISISPDHRTEFDEFETAATRIMARHGGSIERRICVHEEATSVPDEVHIVTFPARANFESYASDPELTALAELRARAILRTVVWAGQDLPLFG